MTSTPKTIDHPLAAALEQAFRQAARNSAFAIGGTVPLRELCNGSLELYYKPIGGEGPIACDAPFSVTAAKRLFDAGAPSPHGQGGKTVYDRTYRDARELKPDRFGMNVDILSASGIVQHIAQRVGTGNLVAKVNKLNMYHEGGFFKVHKDTPLGNTHFGSIVVCLPSAFTGGELVIQHQDHKVTFDFAKDVAAREATLSWAFLFSDVEHSVLPVTRGTRIAIAYDLYHADPLPETSMDLRSTDIASALETLLLKRDVNGFLPSVGLVGIGMMHGCPSDGHDEEYAQSLPRRLKGADKSLLEAIRATDLDCEFNAIFTSDECMEDPDTGEFVDGLRYFRSPDFFLVKGGEMGENGGSVYEFGGILADNVHWLVPPQHYDIDNPYVAYGNQHSIEHVYAAVALIIELPPLDGSDPGPSQLAKHQPEGRKNIFAQRW